MCLCILADCFDEYMIVCIIDSIKASVCVCVCVRGGGECVCCCVFTDLIFTIAVTMVTTNEPWFCYTNLSLTMVDL